METVSGKENLKDKQCSSSSENGCNRNEDTTNTPVSDRDVHVETEELALKREFGLPSATAVNLGQVIGSGIFIMPKGAARGGGSVGLTLVMWAVCGLVTVCGSVATVELATMMPQSGGAYNYYKAAYGKWFAFIFCYKSVLMASPSSMAIMSLTFSRYVMAMFYQDGCGDAPHVTVQILAITVLMLCCAVNCYSVRLVARIHVVATTCKVSALIMIIIGGVVWIARGNVGNFQNSFVGSTTDVGEVALGLYSCLFAYSGWMTVCTVCEELKNPSRDLPRIAWITPCLVAVLYVLTNVSYFSTMSVSQLLDSPAVGLTWAQTVMPRVAWILPLCVAVSTFGSINATIMACSRSHFVLARDGTWPQILSMIDVHRFTPSPSVIISIAIAVLFVCVSTISSLLKFTSFIRYFFEAAQMGCILVLRYRKPNALRPYKVNWLFPSLYGLFAAMMCLAPVIFTPQIEFLYAVITVLAGVVLYLYGTRVHTNIEYLERLVSWLQMLLQVSPPSGKPANLQN